MKIERTIRKQVMAGNSGDIRSLLLNEDQIELVKKIGKASFITAAEISKDLNVSIQNASSKLNRLYRAGYLERLATSAKSGGIEYVYKAQEYGA